MLWLGGTYWICEPCSKLYAEGKVQPFCNKCGSTEVVFRTRAADPTDAFLRCDVCGRKEWGPDKPGAACGMRQPDRSVCAGVLRATVQQEASNGLPKA